MSEIENSDVVQVVVDPADNGVVEEHVDEEPKKGSPEYNFRELREKMEAQTKLINEQQNRIRDLENSPKYQPQEEEADYDDLDSLSKDDYLTVKQAEKLALRKAEELIKQREIETLEDRIRLKYKDYDDVVNNENVQKLIEDDQVLADALRYSPDPYSTAYKLIKKSTFYKEKQEGEKYKDEAKSIQKNSQKPVSSNAVQSKPLARANAYAAMDKQEMDSLFQEMITCARRN